MGADSKRLFFALDPEPVTRERLLEVQSMLDLPGRRVPAANIHMTLAFLGDVPVDALTDLCGIAADLRFPRCTIRLDCVGSFRKSRVGWLGCTRPPPGLLAFQGELARALEKHGFRSDTRPWEPHVTLYRDLRNNCANIELEPVVWRPGEFCLMHSGRCPKGVVYTVVGRWVA